MESFLSPLKTGQTRKQLAPKRAASPDSMNEAASVEVERSLVAGT
jgi:hypothetical protein